ncbi:hypothetical protein QTO34_012635 [Cnephaeus nilssonii]|uniref:Uncharacterized protein n=1 Tax=Cnephaeus nilssonii TaxID=3371016 RepID=A0AA40HAL1_CNENI|nr:hypothetical protein QTO34_012635 [Eptesicus nilssonii]
MLSAPPAPLRGASEQPLPYFRRAAVAQATRAPGRRTRKPAAMVPNSLEKMVQLQRNPANVRNICVLAHVTTV